MNFTTQRIKHDNHEFGRKIHLPMVSVKSEMTADDIYAFELLWDYWDVPYPERERYLMLLTKMLP